MSVESKLLSVAEAVLKVMHPLDFEGSVDQSSRQSQVLSQAAEEVQSIVQAYLQENQVGEAITEQQGGTELTVAPQQARRCRQQRVLAALKSAGITARLGHIYNSESEPCEQPLSAATHQNGLPEFDLCLPSPNSPGPGFYGLFIANGSLFSAYCAEPVAEHAWQIQMNWSFSDDGQMIALLREQLASQ